MRLLCASQLIDEAVSKLCCLNLVLEKSLWQKHVLDVLISEIICELEAIRFCVLLLLLVLFGLRVKVSFSKHQLHLSVNVHGKLEILTAFAKRTTSCCFALLQFLPF